MLQLPIKEAIFKIKSETGLSEEEIRKQILDKTKALEGLVSEEGAAYIVASELGVNLFSEQNTSGPIKISAVLYGMKSIDVVGKVRRIYDAKSFTRKDKQVGQVGSFVLADETSMIRIVLWDKKAEILSKLKEGTIVKVKGALVKQNNLGKNELHVGARGAVILEPKDVKIELRQTNFQRKQIVEINNTEPVSVTATVVQAFSPKLYPTCPQCNKKIIVAPEGPVCSEHKQILPVQKLILNLVLDDCTDTLRSVAFGASAEKLCGLSAKDVLDLVAKDGPVALTEKIENFLLGRYIEVSGNVRKNIVFDRFELSISNVNLDPDPKQIALKLASAVSE